MARIADRTDWALRSFSASIVGSVVVYAAGFGGALMTLATLAAASSAGWLIWQAFRRHKARIGRYLLVPVILTILTVVSTASGSSRDFLPTRIASAAMMPSIAWLAFTPHARGRRDALIASLIAIAWAGAIFMIGAEFSWAHVVALAAAAGMAFVALHVARRQRLSSIDEHLTRA